MKDLKHKLLIEQFDKKIALYKGLSDIQRPEKGWIEAIRVALGMTYKQLSKHLGYSDRTSSQQIVKREQAGSVTLKTLEEAAQSLNMKLVYGFIPKEGSIENIIKKRAYELAKEVVLNTSQNMVLEDQNPSNERLKKAIDDRAQQIIYEMPRYLWD